MKMIGYYKKGGHDTKIVPKYEIKLIHVREFSRSNPFHVYIGRAYTRRGLGDGFKRSPLENPYKITHGRMHARLQCISRYADYLYDQIDRDSNDIIMELMRIQRLRDFGTVYLACWCAPLHCHGEIIIDLLNKSYNHADYAVKKANLYTSSHAAELKKEFYECSILPEEPDLPEETQFDEAQFNPIGISVDGFEHLIHRVHPHIRGVCISEPTNDNNFNN